MEIEELMVGDWVYGVSGSPRKVQGIRDYHPENVVVADHWVSSEKISPIPITLNMLKNNGFSVQKLGNGCYRVEISYEGLKFTFEYREEEKICRIGIGDNMPASFKYVHELQQLLRRCKLKTLAKNFSVV